MRLGPALWHGGIALAVASPLLRGGYLVLLDFALVRQVEVAWWPTSANPGPVNLAPFQALTWLLVKLGYAAGPILVSSIFLVMGVGMHRAAMYLIGSRPGAYIAGTLYAANPFVYERLMAGHLSLLAAYAIAPLVLVATMRFLSEPGVKRSVPLTGWMAAMAWLSIHYCVMAATLILFVSLFSWRRWNRAVCGWGVASVSAFLALNAWWIAGMFAVEPGQRVTALDLEVFATQPRSTASVGNVLALYGFWRHEFSLPKDGVWLWWLVALPVVGTILAGFVIGLRHPHSRRWMAPLLALIPIAAILAAGISFPPTASISRYLFDNFAPYGVFREPQKWAGLLPLSYGLASAVSVARLARRRPGQKDTTMHILCVTLLLSIFVYSHTLIWNWARLRPVVFPSAWYRVDEIIQQDNGGPMLFLPWHQYLSLTFTGHRVVNPAPFFFRTEVLSGDNLEWGGIYTQSVNPVSRRIDSALAERNPAEFSRLLARLCIRWVVLAREADYKSYEWIKSAPGLKRRFDGSGLTLYHRRGYECMPRRL